MKKILLLLVIGLFSPIFADDTTIKGLLSEIEKKVEAKDYKSISENIHSISKGFNVEFITEGIKNPTTQESTDNGFNLDALKKLIKNSDKFIPFKKSSVHDDIKDAFLNSFTDDSKDNRFINALKSDKDDCCYILSVPEHKSMVFIFNDNGHYKLIWWKEMILVANSIK